MAARDRRDRLLLDGNAAAAWGVRLSRPQVMAIYPITPQTPVVTALAGFIGKGELACEYVQVESEHSAMSVCAGASATGARTFTATSSQGLAYMNEMVYMVGGCRLPVVMYLVNRSLAMPTSLQSEHNDAMSMRDAGWIQIHCASCQEVLDTAIQAFAVAEDSSVLLPVVFCADGFILSHAAEAVEVPGQQEVDGFLEPYRPGHVYLDPARPLLVGVTRDDNITEHRFQMAAAMENARQVILEVGARFGRAFGRSYGLMEQTGMEDAEVVLVTAGSMSATAVLAVRQLRLQGRKAGLVRLRVVRPFPSEALRQALRGRKAVGIVERSTSIGSAGGTAGRGAGAGTGTSGCLLPELASALYACSGSPPLVGFVCGLAGRDVRVEDFQAMFDELERAGRERPADGGVTVSWFDLNR